VAAVFVTDDQRRWLAAKGKVLGRELLERIRSEGATRLPSRPGFWRGRMRVD